MRINLLPGEIRERQRVRRQAVAVGIVGALVVAALGAFFVFQQIRLTGLQEDLAQQEATNDQLRQQIAELERFDALQQEAESARTLLASLLANEVLWSGVLRDISLVIPGTAWLTSLSGSLADEAVATATPATAAGGLVGAISFNGNAFDHRTVALWLARLEDVKGFANPWLSNSQKTLIGTREVVQFTSSVDLSEDALARPGGTP
jgi:Tfp pilus assembly protein PilN